jgi:hypothetical protein
VERLLHRGGILAASAQRRKNMKIYLLMLLMGALFAAIHFTSAPEQGSKTLSQ